MEWLIERWDVYDAWISGASICDPTAGQGVFALALMRMARSKGVVLSEELFSRITLIELHQDHLAAFRAKCLAEFGINFPSSNLLSADVVTDTPQRQFDILIGNPPWANFTDLPEWYKERLKPHFIAAGLVPDKKKILLGSSRTDIAALVLKVVLGKLLKPSGMAYFYAPLSLFTGDDAHRGFRDYQANGREFAVDEVCEFTTSQVFDGVSTAYCCARFILDCQQRFPVRYFRQSSGAWMEHKAVPLRDTSDQWRIIGEADGEAFQPIALALSPEQQPRQGVNTCGANRVFVFDEKPAHLPEEFLFPLATKEIWKHGQNDVKRWILLPYDRLTAKPLSWNEIEKHPELRRYLSDFADLLQNRRGTLIQSAVTRGMWWALLGVGPYCFAPYKVMWEAYGKSDFQPTILASSAGQQWQANQAMHAYIPSWDLADAKRICTALKHPNVLSVLRQLNGAGKCNWAQPGKMKKVLSLSESW